MSSFVPPRGRTNLNPNAAEFVPSVFRLNPPVIGSISEDPNNNSLDRRDSADSNAFLDDGSPQCYLSVHLPDDITPDYGVALGKAMEEDDCSVFEGSLLSSEPPTYQPGLVRSLLERTERVPSHARVPPINFHGSIVASELETGRRFAGITSWGQEVPYLGGHQGDHEKELNTRDLALGLGFADKSSEECSFSDNLMGIDVVAFLSHEFPGFPPESIASVLHVNGGDLSPTIKMLTQLELQGLAPFPNGDNESRAPLNLQRAYNMDNLFARSSSLVDLIADTRMVGKSANRWPRIRNSHSFALASPESSVAYPLVDSRFESSEKQDAWQAPSLWMETGDHAANVYTKLLAEAAHDHAQLRNGHFEQARQAYLVGSKAVAKESGKGQWYDSLRKEASESIYTSSARLPQCPSHMLDLNGLHVREAIPRLKLELAGLQALARCTHQRQQAFVYVGNGHHTKGPRTPPRLPSAVERVLLEEQLNYSEPLPGIFRVLLS